MITYKQVSQATSSVTHINLKTSKSTEAVNNERLNISILIMYSISVLMTANNEKNAADN